MLAHIPTLFLTAKNERLSRELRAFARLPLDVPRQFESLQWPSKFPICSSVTATMIISWFLWTQTRTPRKNLRFHLPVS